MERNNSVLIVGPSPHKIGGVSTCVSDLLYSDLERGYNIKYFQSGKGDTNANDIISTLNRTIKQLSNFFLILAKEKIDIIHIHTSSYWGFWRFGVFVFLCKLLDKRTILHMHGAEFKKFYQSNNFVMKKAITLVLESCDSLIVLSNNWKVFFNEIANNAKIEIVYNSVRIPRATIEKSSISNNSKRNITILFLGGLTGRKGLNELLKAIPIVKERVKDVSFIIAGFPLNSEKELFSKLKKQCNEIKEGNDFDLKVNVSNSERSQLYEISDIYVLQSFNEGLPFTLLEAMSYGLSVITTPVGAISEVFENGENGFLITPGDHEKLVEKIIYLIDNPDIRETFRLNNVKKIKNHFSHNEMVEKIDKIYKILLQSNPESTRIIK